MKDIPKNFSQWKSHGVRKPVLIVVLASLSRPFVIEKNGCSLDLSWRRNSKFEDAEGCSTKMS